MGNIKIISLNKDNIADEHICCAISDKKCNEGYEAKKTWLKNQFTDGYIFKKLDVRGKVFIEYVPIEKAWLPLDGSNFMLINCFWVAGRFKGRGHGKALLNECLKDAKSMDGVIAITGDKKRPFMNDSKFFKKQGFELIDTAKPYFQLWCKKNNPTAVNPSFKASAKSGKCSNKKGLVAYYSNTCPFTEYYTNVALRELAQKNDIPVEIIKISSQEDAQKLPIPWVINSVFYNGELLTLHMKIDKILDKAMSMKE